MSKAVYDPCPPLGSRARSGGSGRAWLSPPLNPLRGERSRLRLRLFCRLPGRCGETHFPHPSLRLREVWGRCRDIPTFMGYLSFRTTVRFITLSAACFAASRRDAIRVSGLRGPAQRPRRRGAPAPPPPALAIKARPRHGGRGQGI